MLLSTLLEGRTINYFKGCFMSSLQIMMKLLLAPLKSHLHHRYNNLKYVPHLLTDWLPPFRQLARARTERRGEALRSLQTFCLTCTNNCSNANIFSLKHKLLENFLHKN